MITTPLLTLETFPTTAAATIVRERLRTFPTTAAAVATIVRERLSILRIFFAAPPTNLEDLSTALGTMRLLLNLVYAGNANLPDASENSELFVALRQEVEQLRIDVLGRRDLLDYVRASGEPRFIARYEGLALANGAGLDQEALAKYHLLTQEASRLSVQHRDKAKTASGKVVFPMDTTLQILAEAPSLQPFVENGHLVIGNTGLPAFMAMIRDRQLRELVMFTVNQNIQLLAPDVAAYANLRWEIAQLLNRAHGKNYTWAAWQAAFLGTTGDAMRAIIDSARAVFRPAAAREIAGLKARFGMKDLYHTDCYYLIRQARQESAGEAPMTTLENVFAGIIALLGMMGMEVTITPWQGFCPNLYLMAINHHDRIDYVVLDLFAREGKSDDVRFDALNFIGTQRVGMISANLQMGAALEIFDLEYLIHELGHALQLLLATCAYLGMSLDYGMADVELGSMSLDALLGFPEILALFGMPAGGDRTALYVGEAVLWDRQVMWSELFYDIYDRRGGNTAESLYLMFQTLRDRCGYDTPAMEQPCSIWDSPQLCDGEYESLYLTYIAAKAFSIAMAVYAMEHGIHRLYELYSMGGLFTDYYAAVRAAYPELEEQVFARILAEVYPDA